MANFETALRTEIVTRKATRRSKRLMELLDSKPSKLRTARLARLERHAALVAGVEGGVGFDWGSIDWAKLFDSILALLLKILPLFI